MIMMILIYVIRSSLLDNYIQGPKPRHDIVIIIIIIIHNNKVSRRRKKRDKLFSLGRVDPVGILTGNSHTGRS